MGDISKGERIRSILDELKGVLAPGEEPILRALLEAKDEADVLSLSSQMEELSFLLAEANIGVDEASTKICELLFRRLQEK